MTDPVTIHDGYYKISTLAWLTQRTGPQLAELSSELWEFTRCDVFDEYRPRMDTTARMQLWCAARGWTVAEGMPLCHSDDVLTEGIDIVLAATPGRQALVLVSTGSGMPEVYADVTTDEGYWGHADGVDIACPAGHRWSWDGGADLYTAGSPASQHTTLTALFGGSTRAPYTRCRDCAAFDDGASSQLCPHPCSGTAIYCPTCGQRCDLQLPAIPIYPWEDNR